MWQRFSERARKVIFYAQEEAQKVRVSYVSTEHILLGLVREPDCVAARVLQLLSVSAGQVHAEVQSRLEEYDDEPPKNMTLTPRAKRCIDLAYKESRDLNNNYIGTEHLLLGLIRETDGLAGQVLASLGVELEAARQVVVELQGGPKATPKPKTRPVARLVLLMAVREPEGQATKLLQSLGIDIPKLQYQLEFADQTRAESLPQVSMDSILKVASGFAEPDLPLDSGHLLLAIIQLNAEPTLAKFLDFLPAEELKSKLEVLGSTQGEGGQ